MPKSKKVWALIINGCDNMLVYPDKEVAYKVAKSLVGCEKVKVVPYKLVEVKEAKRK